MTAKRSGRPAGKPAGMDSYERFMTLVDDSAGPDECHLWVGARHRHGHGRFTVDGKKVTASRWLLGYLGGEALRPDEWACHHCDNPPCVNPRHLYVGSAAQNSRDMVVRRRNPIIVAKCDATHCINGHEFTVENTYLFKGRRHCRACNRECKRRRAEPK